MKQSQIATLTYTRVDGDPSYMLTHLQSQLPFDTAQAAIRYLRTKYQYPKITIKYPKVKQCRCCPANRELTLHTA